MWYKSDKKLKFLDFFFKGGERSKTVMENMESTYDISRLEGMREVGRKHEVKQSPLQSQAPVKAWKGKFLCDIEVWGPSQLEDMSLINLIQRIWGKAQALVFFMVHSDSNVLLDLRATVLNSFSVLNCLNNSYKYFWHFMNS